MDKALQTFEGLIRRSIAPSVTFFVVFATGELIAVELAGGSAAQALTGWIRALGDAFGESGGTFGTVTVLAVLGVGYGLSAVQQVLFDNRLKEDFDPGPRSAWLRAIFETRLIRRFRASTESEGRALEELRDKVLERLESEPRLRRFRSLGERTDYVLYEILGGIDPTDTRAFVDSAKAIGVVFSSAIAVTVWNVLVRWPSGWWTGGIGWRQIAWCPGMFALIAVFYWLGREATAAQYRTRALRLYVNFLMMPCERLERRLLLPGEKAGSGPDEEKSA